jgi:chemotaxis protein methyltransferase CheR
MILNDEERYFEALKGYVQWRGGLDCHGYKTNYLKRRLAVRMRATNQMTYQEYFELLRRDSEEYDRLLDRLTINVSHFYRDPEVFEAVGRLVIPSLQKKRTVRIWSAGCANGEEPYSSSILFSEKRTTGRNVILATDLDVACLARAQAGVYKENSLQEIPAELRQKYFTQSPAGWAVSPTVKSAVTFARHDFTGEMPPGPFDLIVCRNVLIYFNRQLQVRLLREFHRLLSPEGFLVLGKTEVLLAECRVLYQAVDPSERIYLYRQPEPEDLAADVGV